jgi:ribosomal protein S18 acetylase RimI-like enzyme
VNIHRRIFSIPAIGALAGGVDGDDALAFIDLLAVDRRFQHRGYGREMLRGMRRL